MSIYRPLTHGLSAITLALSLAGCGLDSPDTPDPTNAAPIIQSPANFAVTEGVAVGEVVYTAKGYDVEGDTISWGLEDPLNAFEIDSVSGEVTVRDNTPLVEELDDYVIRVLASDDDPTSGSRYKEVAIQVLPGDLVVPDPSIVPTESQAVIYYLRDDNNYDDWIIHGWNNSDCNGYADFGAGEGTEWTEGIPITGYDDNYGAYWLINTNGPSSCLNFIIHKGDEKDPNDTDNMLDLSGDRWTFAVSGKGLYGSPEEAFQGEDSFTVKDAAGHLLDGQTIVWNRNTSGNLKLVYSADGSLDENFEATAENSIDLTAVDLTDAQKAIVPHLADWPAYQFDLTDEQIKMWLKGQLIIAEFEDDAPVAATHVQTAKALDAVYTTGANDADEAQLGLSYEGDMVKVAVWAPTAQSLSLNVYDADKNMTDSFEMTADADTGIWMYEGSKADLDRMFYRFAITAYHPVSKAVEQMEATDPYSVNTSTNGRYSQFVNLADADLYPENWMDHQIPTIENFEDAVLLEGHVRDFSVNDATVSAANRGKYKAFTEMDSDAVMNLKGLAESGVTHFHLLPTNDIATIEEDATKRIDLTNTVDELCAANAGASICGVADGSSTLFDVLDSYDPATGDAQALVNEFRGLDGFNWGYDPHHFNVVEGSYASDAEGVARIVEYREMVKALHDSGMRVVMDVVYNHTSASGLWDNSVFDKLVPGYYHRYNEISGDIERSTCCDNTATENRMMGKFVVDSLAMWAEQYDIDGFRFDIMGHMPKSVILEGRDAVAAIDPDTYFYGEGWNWGEVANGRLFEQAIQTTMAGTEVGTFNDRPRDTIRDAALSQETVNLDNADHIRLGLAGTLADFELSDRNDGRKPGSDFGQSSYAQDPADIINYISKHDNETLWDKLQYALPETMTTADRVRVHNLSAAIPVLSQGIPFFQLGVERMRSKSMDRNTYDAGDWFNAIDYTNMGNNWDVGLPLAQDNEGAWDTISGLIANPETAVAMEDINFSQAVFNEFLKIRSSSKLFRLTTEQDVIDRVGFHNTGSEQTPGVIVMSIDDGAEWADLDAEHDAIVVAINGTSAEAVQTIKTSRELVLHSVQQSSADATLAGATSVTDGDTATLTIPAYTIAVFVIEQGDAQGDGISAKPATFLSPFGSTEIFLRGDMNGWDASDMFSYNDKGVYSISRALDAGSYNWKVASEDWSTVDLGWGSFDFAPDSIPGTDQGGNIGLEIAEMANYSFSLDVTVSPYVMTISKANDLIDCAALPDSADPAPFAISGDGSLYVKGSHSDWGNDDQFKLTYKGENRYQAVANFDGEFQFKIASSDWGTEIVAEDADGNTEQGLLTLDTEYSVGYPSGGTPNNQTKLPAGRYSFLVTLNEDDPAKGSTGVGSLLIQQCSE